MPENTDDKKVPDKTADPAPAGSAAETAPKKEAGEDLRAILAEQREKLSRLEQLFTNQRSLHDRQVQRLQRELQASQQARRSRYDELEDEPEPRSSRTATDPMIEHIRKQQEMVSFKTDNPEWSKYWDGILALLGDEQQAQLVAAYKQIGEDTVLDYYKSYHNALREVKLRKMEERDATAEKARQEAEAKKAAQKAQATISGVGAAAVDLETLDIANMTSEQMMDKGLVPIDESDPPRRGLIP